jgi:hypothetical protein
MSTTPDLEAIRARLAAATPGPWETHHGCDDTGYPCYFIHGFSGDAKRDYELHNANVDLLDHAPTDLAALLTHVEAQEARIAALTQERDEALADPAERRAERYAMEAVDLTRRLMATEADVARLQGELARQERFVEAGELELIEVKTQLAEARKEAQDLRDTYAWSYKRGCGDYGQ